MQPIIEVRNLVKRYPAITAVDDVSFSIRPGVCFGLLGPNGAGKTTTVEIMEGIVSPGSGSILYKGSPPGPSFIQEVGIQLQATSLMYFMNTRETLRMFADLYDDPMDLEELTELCQLGDFLERDVRKLSGGQRQRLLFALSLVNDPELIFLDEPTTGLDPQARRRLWEIVRDIKTRGKTLLLTTHYMEEAQELCEEIAIMDQGRIIAQGAPEDLIREHCSGVTISLPVSDLPDPAPGLPGCGSMAQSRVGDRLEFLSLDVNDCIAGLTRAGVNLNSMIVRPSNLEDLFLQLTGRHLRD